MAILRMIFRKMLNNRLLVGSLLLGLILTAALVSSIPTYTSGVLKRFLIEQLEDYQIAHHDFPGGLYEHVYFDDPGQSDDNQKMLEPMESYFFTDIRKLVDLPVMQNVTVLSTEKLDMAPLNEKRYNPDKIGKHAKVMALSDIQKHINITNGRLPKNKPVNGIYEALVPESALVKQNLALGMVLELQSGGANKPLLIKPVGIFEVDDGHDPYWFEPAKSYNESFVIPENLFRKMFVEGSKGQWLGDAKFYSAFDYHAIEPADIGRLLEVRAQLKSHMYETMAEPRYVIEFPIQSLLAESKKKEKQLDAFLWSLNVPILILLGLYLFMVSRLIVDREQTEIAVLRSRGAGRIQILTSYLIEVCLLGLVALLLGPFLGWMIARMLGASNGFLEFVQRSALPVQLTPKSLQFALLAVLAGMVMVMLPVLRATRETIVSRKQQTSRHAGMALWHKFFIDLLLLLAAWYGWMKLQGKLDPTALSDQRVLQVDPLMFYVPALFAVGLGLLCLRLYPPFIRLVYWIGRKFWSVSMYTSLVQVGRSSRQYQFIMLFLMVTIAVGIFSVSAARTLNNNMADQIRYANGADIRLQVRWESNAPPPQLIMPDGENDSFEDEPQTQQLDAADRPEPETIQYTEPPFLPFTKLPGIEHAAKVFQQRSVSVQGNGAKTSTTLMGINPRDFGLTAWFKPHLLRHPFYAYLNLIAKEPSAVLVSRSLAERLNLKPGDYINAEWHNSTPSAFVVYAIIDYWPSWNPLAGDPDDGQRAPKLMVANLPYVQSTMGLEPYEVWINLKANASTEKFYEALKETGFPIIRFHNANQQVVKMKNSAAVMGMNGALTLGFLIAVIVTFLGFLLYWILHLRARVLQYGIFRAMGISFRRLISMLAWEQMLTSGVACLLGIAIGGLTSRLFVPLFQLSFSEHPVPPFHVIIKTGDAVRLYVFIGMMLVIGLAVLGWLLSRIRIHQAVKLGEDG